MFKNDVFRLVYGVLRNQKDAEDAAQEVFLKIFTSLPKYENQGFKTWISRIAINHAIDIKRKQARMREEVSDTYLETASEERSVEETIIQEEKRRKIQERIRDLPENYRDVIYGYYILEKSYEQLANEQQVQVKTIETKLYRARVWIKKHWKEEEFL
ncbi:sigma-70 family RNA polymerase sigma factor [Bacillus kwashiorkori]|uniref:sigma-70 family RNA polymerase sigma factor n=1 Tax=Bacillus kwashiorkori TaxID=1522318 RepID=UPI001EF0B710